MPNDVELNDRRASYIATVGQTVFDIDFPIETEDDFIVYVDGDVITSYATDIDNSTITMNAPMAGGESVVIEGDTQPLRATAYPLKGDLRSSLLNQDIRRLLRIAQELGTKVLRRLSLAQNEDSAVPSALPKFVAGRMLKWGSTPSDGLVNSISDIDNLDSAVSNAAASAASALASKNGADSSKNSAIAAQALSEAARDAAIAAAAGMTWRPPVRVATTANITLSGTQTIDGVALSVGDRVLVKDQSTASQNGVYVVASSAWSRATDADSWAELVSQCVAVSEGTVQSEKFYICAVNTGGTLGVTSISWYGISIVQPIGNNAVGNAQLSDMSANTVKVRSASSSGDPSDLALSANQVLGRGSTGDIAALSFGAGLTVSGTTITGGKTYVAPVPTTSGTYVEISGIPAGTKEIVVTLDNVSTSGASPIIIQMYDASLVSSGYTSNGVTLQNGSTSLTAYTSGFAIGNGLNASAVLGGNISLMLNEGTTDVWTASGCVTCTGAPVASCPVSGMVKLNSDVTRIRITTTGGTDSFDAGNIGIMYA